MVQTSAVTQSLIELEPRVLQCRNCPLRSNAPLDYRHRRAVPPRKRNNREESNFRLAPGDTFTFFSDGVVEAQSPTGELFGFERTGSISRQSAEEIADVAQAFSQEDDITVLTLQFAPA
jgi:hypothetical protein